MKKDLLTVKELAAKLRMSPKSVQRAYRKEEIPVEWMCRMARFDLAQVRRVMEKRAIAMSDSQCTKGRAEFVHATWSNTATRKKCGI
jgi:DNA-binding transcriptional regulator YhcF (GntR family)